MSSCQQSRTKFFFFFFHLCLLFFPPSHLVDRIFSHRKTLLTINTLVDVTKRCRSRGESIHIRSHLVGYTNLASQQQSKVQRATPNPVHTVFLFRWTRYGGS
ncbi:hypothetical protein F4818DRAFT_143072 [Hypoxylon cercidicola]|nr:hypothetical protein F4818DRAFT_143072 [Hypoxylon cercidicola]